MNYTVFIQKSAQKTLAHIPSPFQNHIIHAIRELAHTPRPAGVKKLAGREAWRVRAGKYRVIYEIHDDRLLVLVVAIGHRREVYR